MPKKISDSNVKKEDVDFTRADCNDKDYNDDGKK